MQFSIVNYNKLYESVTFRIDAEFYHPEAIKYENRILSRFHGKTLKEVGCHVVSGPFGSSLKSEAYLNKGIPFVRISDLRDFIISKDNLIYISEDDNERLSSSKLNVGDIVLSKVGNTIGVASKVTSSIGECNISENNIGIRMPSNMRDQEKDLILAYLNSMPGQIQILRAISGNAQPKLNVSDIELLKIPQASVQLSDLISSLIGRSEVSLNNSQDIYLQAQILVLAELGLSNWRSKHQISFVKKYSDTDKAARIDAEYFQPKYDELVKSIKNYSGGWDTLGNLVKSRDKNFIPLDKTEYKYIELSNIAGNGEITDCMGEEGQDLPSRARLKVATGDVIVSSIEGSLSSIALIEKEYDQALCSTGFHVINSKSFNSETLLVLLKSMVGQLQLKKGCNGTILTAINKDEFNKLVLPKVDEAVQSQIQQKITESFNLRKQSKHLLECGKRAVEIAIEQNEEASMKWLETETGSIG